MTVSYEIAVIRAISGGGCFADSFSLFNYKGAGVAHIGNTGSSSHGSGSEGAGGNKLRG